MFNGQIRYRRSGHVAGNLPVDPGGAGNVEVVGTTTEPKGVGGVRVEKNGPVTTVIMNRPEARRMPSSACSADAGDCR
ncbi:hypothetical protein MPRS_46600 [Mycobacterium paraseoulense]|nr:hypothetical protein MPRS_46600 [Mycobacterium paraseoulense]